MQKEIPKFVVTSKEQVQINADARAYLILTDWYILRSLETGKGATQELLDERAKARAAVGE